MASPSAAVLAATAESLPSVDYGAVFEVIDVVNRNEASIPEVAGAIQQRLGTGNSHVVDLTLELLEACVKNENTNFHAGIATDSFLDALAAVGTTGSAGASTKALGLLQQLGCEPQLRSSMPIFRTYYTALREHGVAFPVVEEGSVEALFTPLTGAPAPAPAPAATSGVAPPPGIAPSSAPAPSPDQAARIAADSDVLVTQLGVMRERIVELASLISAAGDGTVDLLSNDTFLDLLDFAEQCFPRLELLVRVGSQGHLREDGFALVLELQEPLTRVINAGKIVSGLVEMPAGYTIAHFDVADIATMPAPAPAPVQGAADAGSAGGDDLLGLGAPAPPSAAEQADADEWAIELPAAAPAPADAAPAVPPAVPAATPSAVPPPAVPASTGTEVGGGDLDDLFGAPAVPVPAVPAAAPAPAPAVADDPFTGGGSGPTEAVGGAEEGGADPFAPVAAVAAPAPAASVLDEVDSLLAE